jgi:hypothetical protein
MMGQSVENPLTVPRIPAKPALDAGPAIQDRFTGSYTAWAALLFLFFVGTGELDRIFNLYLFVVPLVLVPTAVAFIAFLVALARNGIKWRWRRLLSLVAAPFAAWALLWLAAEAGLTPQRIRFEWGRSFYAEEVARISPGEWPRFKTWDWGGTGGVAVPNIFYTLIYDETDEIALPLSGRSEGWKRRVGASTPMVSEPLEGAPIVTVKKLTGHFYVMTVVYP